MTWADDQARRSRRSSRVLNREERRLWASVAREIAPLKGKATVSTEDPQPAATEIGKAVPAASVPKLAPYVLARAPSMETLERKTITALRRGKREVEAKLDLHGMRQQEAHSALIGFLRRSQFAGRTLVLVVTGKGAPASLFSPTPFEERGVLRRMTPHWLAAPELRSIVLGYDEAAIRHGGTGAFYVRLRKLRE